MRIFSVIISRIFDFYFWFPILLVVSLLNTGLTGSQLKILFPLLLTFDIILPIFFFFLFLKLKLISDIDVTERKERHKLLIGICIFFTLGTITTIVFGNKEIFILHLITLIMAIVMFSITLKYKISGHLFMASGSIYILNYLLNYELLYLFLLLIPIAISRIYLKKHDIFQILLGGLLGFLIPIIILKFTNLL